MGFIQIGASILTSLLIGALTRFAQTARVYLLLAFSILAVYWFQSAVPLRSFDFWLPSLTLVLVVLTWLIISQREPPAETVPSRTRFSTWRSSQNLIALSMIVGLPGILALTRSEEHTSELQSPYVISYAV